MLSTALSACHLEPLFPSVIAALSASFDNTNASFPFARFLSDSRLAFNSAVLFSASISSCVFAGIVISTLPSPVLSPNELNDSTINLYVLPASTVIVSVSL